MRAADMFEKLGAAQDLEKCKEFLQEVEERKDQLVISDEPGDDGELPV